MSCKTFWSLNVEYTEHLEGQLLSSYEKQSVVLGTIRGVFTPFRGYPATMELVIAEAFFPPWIRFPWSRTCIWWRRTGVTADMGAAHSLPPKKS